MNKLKGMLVAVSLLSLVAVPALMAAETISTSTATTSSKTGWWKCGYAKAFQHTHGATYSYGYVSNIGWLKSYDNGLEEQLLAATSGGRKTCVYFISSSRWRTLRSF